jgi:hypothetical protein
VDSQHAGVWGEDSPREVLAQVADLCKKVAPLDLKPSMDGASFSLSAAPGIMPRGIVSVFGKVEENVVTVKVELFRGAGDARVSSAVFFRHLSTLGERIRLVPPQEEGTDGGSLWVELKVQATPLSLTRAEALLGELTNLRDLAVLLQSERPAAVADPELKKLYGPFGETLEPIHPWLEPKSNRDPGLIAWAEETCEFLDGSMNVALAAEHPICLEAALAEVAGVLREQGRTLGGVILPAVNSRGLLDLSRKAPGIVVVGAGKVSLGSNPYDLANEMRSLLLSLAEAHKPALFTGSYEELQSIFHGGQGAVVDPMVPVLRRVPQIAIQALVRFAVMSAGRRQGGIPVAALNTVVDAALNGLRRVPEGKQVKILSALAVKGITGWALGKTPRFGDLESFAVKTAAISETLSGLSPRPRSERTAEVQERFVSVLGSPGLLKYFQEHLLAQDEALTQLCRRLEMECLTRPLHQPLRYCAQSPPGTGKSESAQLLARILEVPYVNIDAASMSDHHTAAAQLLGSGRGIVGSFQAGRLEQAAKHHAGVVVEVSDLDHAVPSVRSSLADLFLQVLDTGEAQSSVGAMFSCANVIFAFTMNLPGGMDEQLHKGIGFTYSLSRGEMRRRVAEAIKSMLSGAFLSRVGTPIVFDPLDGKALVTIVERAIRDAAFSAAERLGACVTDVFVEPGTGEEVLNSLDANLMSFGARALLEHGRSLAARAILRWLLTSTQPDNHTPILVTDEDGELTVLE